MYIWKMNFVFHKYHGTGNDFIIIDDRENLFAEVTKNDEILIANLCHRQFGIGADGLILLKQVKDADFYMDYFNSNGKKGSFCGNGSRCAVAFAHYNGIIQNTKVSFAASDGMHSAEILSADAASYGIAVRLTDTLIPEKLKKNEYFANTGSPHLVIFVKDLTNTDVSFSGAKMRYSSAWREEGVNVNFAEFINSQYLYVKTYERGVEKQTLSCGTGVTAAAIAAYLLQNNDGDTSYRIKTDGGELSLSFKPPDKDRPLFTNICLSGPAQFVFSGDIRI